MNEDEIFETVSSCIRATFGQPGVIITRETTADDVDGWDSLLHATLMFRIEKRLNVRIPREIAAGFEDVGALTDAICRLKKAS
jgi:acyl carrier protein